MALDNEQIFKMSSDLICLPFPTFCDRTFPPFLGATNIFAFTPQKFNIAPEKVMVGRLLSFWDGNFSGAMLNVGSVRSFVPTEHVGDDRI